MQKSVPRENLLAVFISELLNRRLPLDGGFLSHYNVFVRRKGVRPHPQISKD